jgi:hypothetical protein
MDPMRLPVITINWKPERKKKNEIVPEELGKMGCIVYIAMSERGLRMGEWNSRRQWNMEVGRRRQTF